MTNEHIMIDNNLYEKVKMLKYLGSFLANQSSIYEEIKSILKAGNSYSVQTL